MITPLQVAPPASLQQPTLLRPPLPLPPRLPMRNHTPVPALLKGITLPLLPLGILLEQDMGPT